MSNKQIKDFTEELDSSMSDEFLFQNQFGITKKAKLKTIQQFSSGVTQVRSQADLPAPLGGSITLGDNITYKFIGNVILTLPIILGANTALIGDAGGLSKITFLSNALNLISSTNTNTVINNLSIDTLSSGNSTNLFNLNGDTDKFCIISRCFFNVKRMGSINNFSAANFNTINILQSLKGLEFNGTFSSIFFSNFTFQATSTTASLVLFKLNTGVIVTNRVNIIGGTFLTLNASQIAISVNFANVSVLNESFEVVNCSFQGVGIKLSGHTESEDQSYYKQNINQTSSYPFLLTTLSGNAVATNVISGTKVPIDFNSALIKRDGQRFDVTGDYAEYVGAKPRKFQISALGSILAGSNSIEEYKVYLAINDTVILESEQSFTTFRNDSKTIMSLFYILKINPGDTLNIYIEGVGTNTDITLVDLKFTLTEL